MGGKIGFGDDFIEEDMPWYRLGMPKMELKLLKEADLLIVEGNPLENLDCIGNVKIVIKKGHIVVENYRERNFVKT